MTGKQLEIKSFHIQQEIENFILPPNTWYRDIGGKYSRIDIHVGLHSKNQLESNEIIELVVTCHYESGYQEEVYSDKPLFRVLGNFSRLTIDHTGTAMISLRFEQLSTRHFHEVSGDSRFSNKYSLEICHSYFSQGEK